jgi:CO dehydrogenase/acetyl-CoA synthase beta subunit
MTTCGCCECIAAMLPSCNGVMTVNRDYMGVGLWTGIKLYKLSRR